MTTRRSLLSAVNVHGFLDVELMVKSMSTGPRVFWPSGTDGVMRMDSESQADVPVDNATVVVPSVGVGFGVGEGVVGTGAETGRSSSPLPGQNCRLSQAIRM